MCGSCSKLFVTQAEFSFLWVKADDLVSLLRDMMDLMPLPVAFSNFWPLLPALRPNAETKKTLLLDLDHTLIFTEDVEALEADSHVCAASHIL